MQDARQRRKDLERQVEDAVATAPFSLTFAKARVRNAYNPRGITNPDFADILEAVYERVYDRSIDVFNQHALPLDRTEVAIDSSGPYGLFNHDAYLQAFTARDKRFLVELGVALEAAVENGYKPVSARD